MERDAAHAFGQGQLTYVSELQVLPTCKSATCLCTEAGGEAAQKLSRA